MKAERAAVDRCRFKNANMDEFAMMRFAVVEEFLAKKAIEPRPRSREVLPASMYTSKVEN
jgi:hypothetical protein